MQDVCRNLTKDVGYTCPGFQYPYFVVLVTIRRERETETEREREERERKEVDIDRGALKNLDGGNRKNSNII